MALVIVLVLGYMKYTQKPPEPAVRPAVKPAAAGETVKTFALPNEPSFAAVIARKDVLGLDEKQIGALRELEKGWGKDSAPLRAEMNKLNDEMGKFLDTAKKPSMEEIKKKAAPLSDVSAKYAELRKEYEKKIAGVLTQEQAAKLAELDEGKR